MGGPQVKARGSSGPDWAMTTQLPGRQEQHPLNKRNTQQGGLEQADVNSKASEMSQLHF